MGQENGMAIQLKSVRARLLSRIRKLRQDDNGAAAVFVAVLAPVVIGGMGLGAETGYWYYMQRKLQHAADVAAYGAGVRKRVGDAQPGLQNAALDNATKSGFSPYWDHSTPNPTVKNLTVSDPPERGALKGRSDAVEISLYEDKPRLLSSIFSKEMVRIGGRAVAQVTGGASACVLALSDTAPRAIEVSGSTDVTLNGCSIASNSVDHESYYMPNSTAELTADCISTVGEAVIKKPSPDLLEMKCPAVQEQSPKILDPYADVEEPTVTTCSAKGQFSATKPPTPGCYRGMSLSGRVTFPPGLYIIDGADITLSGGSTELHGNGVTFFFKNGATADLTGTPMLDLTAPGPKTTIEELKPFIGILFFSERCSLSSYPTGCTEVFKITGSSGSTVKGAIYLPGSRIEYLGNSMTTSSCLQIIADKVTFTGNSTITMGSSCQEVGTRDVMVGRIVRLVE
jgi:hypothetical protein